MADYSEHTPADFNNTYAGSMTKAEIEEAIADTLTRHPLMRRRDGANVNSTPESSDNKTGEKDSGEVPCNVLHFPLRTMLEDEKK